MKTKLSFFFVIIMIAPARAADFQSILPGLSDGWLLLLMFIIFFVFRPRPQILVKSDKNRLWRIRKCHRQLKLRKT